MHVRCEHCGLDMEAPSGSVGRSLRCPQCHKTFVCRLPQAVVVEPEPEPEEIVLEDEIVAEEPAEELLELTEAAEEFEEVSPLDAAAEATANVDEALDQMQDGTPKTVYKESPRQWYVMVGGVAAVALTYAELKHKAAVALVKPKTKIYYAPKDVTLMARDVPGLFPEDQVKPRRRRKLSAKQADAVDDLAAALGQLGDEPDEPPQPPEGPAAP